MCECECLGLASCAAWCHCKMCALPVSPGDIDFALNGDGRWDIKVQAVQCPVGDTTIQYLFQGSNPWYIKLQIRNARIPIVKVELQKGDQWMTPVQSSDGFWVLKDFGFEWPKGPISVKLTAANCQVLYDQVPKIGELRGLFTACSCEKERKLVLFEGQRQKGR